MGRYERVIILERQQEVEQVVYSALLYHILTNFLNHQIRTLLGLVEKFTKIFVAEFENVVADEHEVVEQLRLVQLLLHPEARDLHGLEGSQKATHEDVVPLDSSDGQLVLILVKGEDVRAPWDLDLYSHIVVHDGVVNAKDALRDLNFVARFLFLDHTLDVGGYACT